MHTHAPPPHGRTRQDSALSPDMRCEVLGTLAAVCDAVPLEPAVGSPVGVSGTAGAANAAGGPSWQSLLVGCDIFGALAASLATGVDSDVLLEAVALAGALAGHARPIPYGWLAGSCLAASSLNLVVGLDQTHVAVV